MVKIAMFLGYRLKLEIQPHVKIKTKFFANGTDETCVNPSSMKDSVL